MISPSTPVLLVLSCLFVSNPCCLRAQPSLTSQVDRVFAQFDKPDSPGCAIAVIKDGKVIYKRAYGMADLEHAVPLTTTSVFMVASVSKQFTAFAIHLLAQDGRLRLEDDIHKYIPEMHDFGRSITINHLLHHTSGLRDEFDLLEWAGWRSEDMVTQNDILQLAYRQRGLNFSPGEEYSYSNAGYTLLAEIVKRVSGKTLSAFAEERIFRPLGMNNTHIQDDPGRLVKNIARAYQPAPGGFKRVVLTDGRMGSTDLFTTVEDLALWDQNFYDGKVGGIPLIEAMHVKARLNSGKDTAYGSGLRIDTYRGLRRVYHAGLHAGYRTCIMRFPEERFTVIVLGNVTGFLSVTSARKVADIYLADKLLTQPEPLQPPNNGRSSAKVVVSPTARDLDDISGWYRFPHYETVHVIRKGDGLAIAGVGADSTKMSPLSVTEFAVAGSDAKYIFKKSASGEVTGAERHSPDGDDAAFKFVQAIPNDKELSGYAGTYYSEELGALLTVLAKPGRLYLRNRTGEMELKPGMMDEFIVVNDPTEVIAFARDRRKRVVGLTVNTPRMRTVVFKRVELRSEGNSMGLLGLYSPMGMRRPEVLTAMQRVMGDLPRPGKRVPLDVKVEAEERTEKFIRRKISYQSYPGERVPAYLLIPLALKGKAPAMLCLTQTSSFGKNEVVGLEGKPDLHTGKELAERGYVVLAPDYPTLGEYKIDVYAEGWQSGSMKAIWDNIRGIDLLQSLPEVDGSRIGAIGHSLGGHNSLFTAAYDERIKCVVTNCGFTSFARYYGGDIKGWAGPRYMPRIKSEFPTPDKMPFDFDGILAAIAPRPVFVSAPERDANFDVTGVRETVARAGAVYEKLHALERLAAIYPECEHEWPWEYRKRAYEWVDRWLNGTRGSSR